MVPHRFGGFSLFPLLVIGQRVGKSVFSAKEALRRERRGVFLFREGPRMSLWLTLMGRLGACQVTSTTIVGRDATRRR